MYVFSLNTATAFASLPVYCHRIQPIYNVILCRLCAVCYGKVPQRIQRGTGACWIQSHCTLLHMLYSNLYGLVCCPLYLSAGNRAHWPGVDSLAGYTGLSI